MAVGKKQGITHHDAATALSSPVFHPSTGIAMFTFAMGAWLQVSPRDFLPDRLVGTKVHGVKVQKIAMLPLSTVMVLYGAAGVEIYEGRTVRGHMASMLLSFACAGFSMGCARISMFYWISLIVYFSYGAFYDGRRIAKFSDGAPTYRFGDISRIRAERREAKAQARAEHDMIVELRRRQYEAALAAQRSV